MSKKCRTSTVYGMDLHKINKDENYDKMMSITMKI